MLRRLLAIALCTTVVATAARPSLSAEPPSAEEIKAARARYAQGKVFFEQGLYKEAIVEYQAAYVVVAEPLLLFNIALAQSRLGDVEAALASYRAYLELDPEGVVSDEARAEVVRLTPEVDERRRQREGAERQARQREAVSGDARKARVLRWSAYGTVGVGLVGIGLGIKFGMDARSAADTLNGKTGAWTEGELALQGEFRTARTRAYIAGGAGAACLITAGVLLWLGVRAEPDDLQVVPTAGPDRAGLSLVGWF
jgi:tetratricopeptide (TPR) repeat protein